MEAPKTVPDAVIDSIAISHVKYQRAGECPMHDRKWQGRYVTPWENRADCGPDVPAVVPCTCQVRMQRFEEILKALRWSGDHYSFNLGSMYVGVELDGYMHT